MKLISHPTISEPVSKWNVKEYEIALILLLAFANYCSIHMAHQNLLKKHLNISQKHILR